MTGSEEELMDVVQHDTAHSLCARTNDWLHTEEAENNLVLGICEDLARGGERVPLARQLLSVEHKGRVTGVAILTAQQKLVITRMPLVAVDRIAEFLWSEKELIFGAVGPATTTTKLPSVWSERSGQLAKLQMDQRIYACRSVRQLEFTNGELREGRPGDRQLLCDWAYDFHLAVDAADANNRCGQIVEDLISTNRIFVWEDSGPVSCAAFSRQTRSGVAVNYVYTPPGHRGAGYATACVAVVTRRLLDAGRRFCCLYADLTNTTANRIYQRIGYEPVCDAQSWRFD